MQLIYDLIKVTMVTIIFIIGILFWTIVTLIEYVIMYVFRKNSK